MKRFTETGKWANPWFRKLPPRLKLLWQFICDNCDHAGVLDMDWELASFQIGETVSLDDLAKMDGKIAVMKDGKLHVKTFVLFQFGTLSEDCKAHIPIFKALAKHGLLIGYPYPLDTLQEKEKEKEKDGERVQGERPKKDRGTAAEVSAFFESENMLDSDAEWFFLKCEGCDWTNNGKPIKDWKATVRSWRAGKFLPSQKHGGTGYREIEEALDLVACEPTDYKALMEDHRRQREIEENTMREAQ